MKRLFEIDWTDNYGPDYIKAEDVIDCLVTDASFPEKDAVIQVTDVTSEKKTAPPLGGHDF